MHIQYPGNSSKQPADHENYIFMQPNIVAEAFHAYFIFSNSLQAIAKGRFGKDVERDETGKANKQCEVKETCGGIAKRWIRYAPYPTFPSEELSQIYSSMESCLS
jgi:hypothetical protein